MSGRTTHKQNAAIVELLKGSTFDQAAEAAGVTERTMHRWWRDPLFRTAYYQEQTAKIDRVLMPLLELAGYAVNALADVMAKPTQSGASNRRLAAQAIIESVLKMRDRTIDERLTELEAQVWQGKQTD